MSLLDPIAADWRLITFIVILLTSKVHDASAIIKVM